MDTKNISYEGGYVHHGHKLRDLRKQQNLEIADLAKKVKISQEDIEKLEESRLIDDETLQKMAEALDVSVETIKSLKEERTPLIVQNNTYTQNNENNTNSNIEEDNVNGGNITKNKTLPSILEIAEAFSLMLKMERERSDKLEQRIKELEKELKEKENPSSPK